MYGHMLGCLVVDTEMLSSASIVILSTMASIANNSIVP
jgi:hypothetical protein